MEAATAGERVGRRSMQPAWVRRPISAEIADQARALQLARENMRLAAENSRLRDENADLAASAEIWIRLYEAALARTRQESK
jgi:hypothetical protein